MIFCAFSSPPFGNWPKRHFYLVVLFLVIHPQHAVPLFCTVRAGIAAVQQGMIAHGASWTTSGARWTTSSHLRPLQSVKISKSSVSAGEVPTMWLPSAQQIMKCKDQKLCVLVYCSRMKSGGAFSEFGVICACRSMWPFPVKGKKNCLQTLAETRSKYNYSHQWFYQFMGPT